jgi:hypothetical protein
MNNVKINKITKEESSVHDNLLKSFTLVFCSRDVYNIGLLLHDNGLFFNKMNKTVAESLLFSVLFNDLGLGGLYNIEVKQGVSTDHFPGEPVLEFHCSEYPRLKTEEDEGEEYKELINTNKKIPKTYRFAFSFKDELIFTIRKPRAFSYKIEELIQLN